MESKRSFSVVSNVLGGSLALRGSIQIPISRKEVKVSIEKWSSLFPFLRMRSASGVEWIVISFPENWFKSVLAAPCLYRRLFFDSWKHYLIKSAIGFIAADQWVSRASVCWLDFVPERERCRRGWQKTQAIMVIDDLLAVFRSLSALEPHSLAQNRLSRVDLKGEQSKGIFLLWWPLVRPYLLLSTLWIRGDGGSA